VTEFLPAHEQILEPDTQGPEFYNQRGAASHARGDLNGALADFDRALYLNPHYAEAYNNRGAVRHARGEIGRALVDFDRALDLNPRYAEAYNNRGAARHARGDLAGAITDFDRALEFTPNCDAASIYHNRGAARQGDIDGAIADFNRALEIDPGYCIAYIARGNARYHKRDPECQADYRAAFFLDARLTAREIVRLLDDGLRHDLDDVMTSCRKHLRTNPADLVARARRGLTLVLLDRDPEAYHDLRRIFKQCPGWKLFLQLLVEEAKHRRGTPFARVFRGP
jgi:tetratricopeptide (TPR) repeat protein